MMRLPSSVFTQFSGLENITSDAELLSIMTKQPLELLKFFETVVEFDSWCEAHPEFMTGVLNWFTVQAFQDRLSVQYFKQVAQAVHEHFSTLDRFLPRDITLDFKEKSLEANSLLVGASSPVLRQRIMDECYSKNRTHLKIEEATYEEFLAVDEFINTGDTWKFWRKSKEALLTNLKQAEQWQMRSLVDPIQDSIRRFIDSGTMIELLLLSHEKGWDQLKKECIAFINEEGMGVRFIDKGKETLAMEFLDFREKALSIFDDVKSKLTHLVAGGVIIQDPLFREVIYQCPLLFGIDIAHSSAYSENLKYLPPNLHELDVSKCGWLNKNTLKELIQTCPRLTTLDIGSNSQLNYNAWSELLKLREMSYLNVGRSHQMTNEDFKIILKACRSVIHLNLEDCSKVSEELFFEIGRSVPLLESLNVSRTTISDSSLIEIASRCKNLAKLDISRCLNLTNKGVLETVREAMHLHELHLEKVNISPSVLEEIKQLSPSLLIS